MKRTRRKLPVNSKSASNQSLRGNGVSARLPSDYSLTNLRVGGIEDNSSLSKLFDYQLTVRPKVELSSFQISMLLEVKCYEIWKYGLKFVDWLSLEFLFSRLLGSKKVWEVRDEKQRKVLTFANLILLTTQNSWLSLDESCRLPDQIQNYLSGSGLLISERTYFSRIEYWRPEKFLEVRAVPLEVFIAREERTVRYSSYTKGYGESSRLGRRQKTRPSTELDGEDGDRPEVVIPLAEIPNLLYLTMLELRRKFEGKR